MPKKSRYLRGSRAWCSVPVTNYYSPHVEANHLNESSPNFDTS